MKKYNFAKVFCFCVKCVSVYVDNPYGTLSLIYQFECQGRVLSVNNTKVTLVMAVGYSKYHMDTTFDTFKVNLVGYRHRSINLTVTILVTEAFINAR